MTQEIYRKIGFDASQAISELNALGEAVNNAGAQLAAFSKSKGLGQAFGNAGAGAKELNQNLVQFADGSKRAIKDLNGLVSGAQRVQAGLKPLGGELDKASNAAKKGATAFGKFGQTLKTILVTRAIIGVIGGITGAFRNGIGAAKDYGLAIQEIQTIAKPLALTTEELSTKVLNLSNSLGTDALDTAKGLYQVLSNQVVEAADSFTFLAEAQKLAITTVATTGEAVDSLSSVMNAYSLTIQDTKRVSDTLFEAVNVGRFTLDEIANIIGRVTPLTAEMGITWEETAAAISTMTQSGVRADTAITQLRAVVIKLLKPTEAMKDVFREWGVKDGPTAIATFGGLRGVLEKLTQETNGSTEEMTKFFNEVRGLAGALGLGIDEGERFAKTMEAIEGSTGAAAEAFQGFQASTVQQMVIETNKLNNEMIKLGTAVQPVIIGLSVIAQALAQTAAAGVNSITDLFNTNAKLARENAQKIADIEAGRGDSIQAFTRFSNKEYQKRKTDFLQNLAEAQKGFEQFISIITARQAEATAKMKDFGKGIASSFKDAFKALQTNVDDFDKRIQQSRDTIGSLEIDLDDEKLSQSLEKAFNAFQKFKILQDDANNKTRDALKQLNDPGQTEESKKQASAAADRAIAAEKAVEASAREAGNFRAVQEANDNVVKLIEGKIKAEKTFAKNQEDQRGKELKLLETLKSRESELKALIKQRVDAIKLAVAAQKEGTAEWGRALERVKAIDALIKGKGFSKAEFDIFKNFDKEGLVNNFNEALSGLDTARIDWASAVSKLEQELSNIRVKVQLATPGGTESQAFAEQFNIPTDPNDLPGTAAKVSAESEKRLKAEADARAQSNAALKQQLATQEVLGSTVDATTQSINAQVEQLKSSVSPAELLKASMIKMAKGPEDAQRYLESVTELSNAGPLSSLAEDAKSIQEDLALNKVQEAVPKIDALKIKVQELKAAGVLNNETAGRFNELFGVAIPAAVSATITRVKALETATKAAKDAELAEQWLNIQGATGNAAANGTLLRNSMAGIGDSLVGANTQVGTLKTGLTEAKTAATETGTAGAQIGPSTASSIPGINATTQAMAALKAEAIAAAQAVAAASGGGGGGAFYGKYFAQGGLGTLRPQGGDTIPAMIQKGEFVSNAKSSRKYYSQLNAINQDRPPVYRREGGPVTNVGDVNVSVNGGDTSRQTVRAIAVELNRELKRGTIRLGSLRKA